MMRQMRGAIAAGVLSLGAAPPPAADLVIQNAKVFTAEAGRPLAEAVVVDDGVIRFVGVSAQARRYVGPETQVVDAGGRLVAPGLIEAHAHSGPFPPGRTLALPGLPWPGPTPEETLAAVKAAAAGEKGWLIGEIGAAMMADDRDWRSALDAVAPDTAVYLRPWWGHGMTLNSRALAAAGVRDGDPDPIGGWYGRTASGRLNGRVREGAEIAALRRLAATVPASEASASFDRDARMHLGWGVTSFHQMAHNMPMATTMAALGSTAPSIKWSVYGWGLPVRSVDEGWAEFAAAPKTAGRARLAGVKWMLDATPIERDARMRQPYLAPPGWRGRSNYTDAQLRDILRGAARGPAQTAFHVSGDGEMARLFDAMEAVAPAATWLTRRVRIEHADGLTRDLIPQAKRLGVVIVANPLHVAPSKDETGQEMMVARLGAERAREFQLVKTLLREGVPLAFGSDAGGPAANPFLNMMVAVRYELNPAEAVTREEALLAYTAGAAFAEGEEVRKGRLAPGMAADIAVLSQDVLTVPLERLPATRSLLTLVDGTVAHRDPALAVTRPGGGASGR